MKTKQTAAFLVDNYLKVVNYPNHQRADEKCKIIYLFRNPTVNLCKIGVTNNLYARFYHLEKSVGMKLQCLIALAVEPNHDENPRFIERYLHKYFKEKRKEGEWFDLSIRDILAIKNLFWEIYGNDIVDNVKECLLENEEGDLNLDTESFTEMLLETYKPTL